MIKKLTGFCFLFLLVSSKTRNYNDQEVDGVLFSFPFWCRSNKGASKQRRDQINAEIATMRDLLPLPETARQRLSQLQIMSLSCVYIRKCNVLQKRECNS